MYRKKTLLLNECNNTNKPIGIAVLVADQRRTAVRISVKGANRQNAYLFVDADDLLSCKRFTTSVGAEFFTSPTLLERVSCLILAQDLTPLCFASSIGQSLSKEFLIRAVDTVKKYFLETQPTTQSNLEQKTETKQPLDPCVEVEDAVTPTPCDTPKSVDEEKSVAINTPKKVLPDECLCTDTSANLQLKTDFFDTFTSPKQKNLSLDFEGNYDEFVIATKNYYDDDNSKRINLNEQNKAKVSLSAYKKALEDFYLNKNLDEYYLKSVAKELQGVFDSFAPYLPLMKKIEDSFFVKITDDKDNFFGLGVLKQNDEPIYICYALPIKQKEQKPFLTVSVNEEDKQIDFCLIMQSAKDGKIFKAVG